MDQGIFNPAFSDAVGEIMSIGLGSSAVSVSKVLGHRVNITPPSVQVVDAKNVALEEFVPAVGATAKYISGLNGRSIMLLRGDDMKAMTDILLDLAGPSGQFLSPEMGASAVCELMSQMVGASATALAEMLGQVVEISAAEFFEVKEPNDLRKSYLAEIEEPIVLVRFKMIIEDVLESEIMDVMSVDDAKMLATQLGAKEWEPSSETMPVEAEAVAEAVQTMEHSQIVEAAPLTELESKQEAKETVVDEKTAAPQQENMVEQQTQTGYGAYGQYPYPYPYPYPPYPYPYSQSAPQAQVDPKIIDAAPPRFEEFIPERRLDMEQKKNLDLIMGVPLEVSVEIGRTRSKVQDILTFSKGSLVVLDKMAGDQVDLFVNGQCVARGDVVVINDNFGVRITEILQKPDMNVLAGL
ncbi:MAG: flagellar motor switch phosphatase FliY [Firmicutes bacterium]|nr:flagellar motor switch phosphatase FliY [Bacillota bacterium]